MTFNHVWIVSARFIDSGADNKRFLRLTLLFFFSTKAYNRWKIFSKKLIRKEIDKKIYRREKNVK